MRIPVRLISVDGRSPPGFDDAGEGAVEAADGATLADVLASLGLPADEDFAALVNGEPVAAADRRQRRLKPGDALVVFPPIKGGRGLRQPIDENIGTEKLLPNCWSFWSGCGRAGAPAGTPTGLENKVFFRWRRFGTEFADVSKPKLGKPAIAVRPMVKGLKVMLVTGRDQDAAEFETFLAEAGHRVVGRAGETDDLAAAARACRPDVVVIDAASPLAGLLAAIVTLCQTAPRPIALFYDAATADDINAAVGAGVSTLIPGKATRERLAAAIDVAVAQFGETNRLLQERDRATTALAERKLVERAKGIIMKQRGLDEDAAYKFMRQAAMNKNLRLGQLAASIIEAEELLG